MSFRRNFDAEAAARARGERPKGIGSSGGRTTPSPEPPIERIIVIPKTDRILADLLARKCAIKPVGADWHIRARTQFECDAIVGMLKLKGVHGVLKRTRSVSLACRYRARYSPNTGGAKAAPGRMLEPLTLTARPGARIWRPALTYLRFLGSDVGFSPTAPATTDRPNDPRWSPGSKARCRGSSGTARPKRSNYV